jgi:phenylpyruvate tautomerase PptA (4-oxalocrotonate tautomerase family)
MPFVHVRLVGRAFTGKHKHGLAARLTADTPHRAS